MSVDFGGNKVHWAERSQSRKKENLTKTSDCEAHCSYFKRVFGQPYQNELAQEKTDDTLHGVCAVWYGRVVLKMRQMCSGSITLCPSCILVSVHPLPPSQTLSGSFAVRKDLSKQTSWTNRLWDEFLVGFWQQRAEAEVPVSVCTELSKSDKVVEMKTEWTCSEVAGCGSPQCEQENTRCSDENLFNNTEKPSRDIT